MKKPIFIAMLILLAVTLFAQNELDRPVAIVKLYKTEVITSTQLQNAINQIEAQSEQPLTDEEIQFILDNMVYEKLILQAAENAGIIITEEMLIENAVNRLSQQVGVPVSRADFRASIERQGLNFDEYINYSKKQLIVQQYVMQVKGDYISGTPEPTEEQIQNFFEANETKYIQPALMRFSHIFYTTRGLSVTEQQTVKDNAEAAFLRIQNGSSFESVLSTTPNSDPNVPNGDMGYIAKGSQQVVYLLGADFVNRIFQLSVGDTALIKSVLGYHIVKITEFSDKKFLSLDDPISPNNPTTVYQQIYNEMYAYMIQLIFQEASQEVIQELLDDERSSVQYFEDNY